MNLESTIELRDVIESDLPIFFENQLDEEANYMAAFTAKDPTDREAFDAHWTKIMASETAIIKTILDGEQIVGSVLRYEMEGDAEVSYWIGKDFWGKGYATQGLAAFVALLEERPLYGRAAKDNLGSIRVMEKCGFSVKGYGKYFANARGEEIEEVIMELK